MPEDEWEDWGDNFERPFGEGSSKSVTTEVFRVYFKGLVEKTGPKHVLGGIGVAICDSSDRVLFELSKPLPESELNRHCVEFKALIEALNAAIALELKRVVFYCDYRPIYRFVSLLFSLCFLKYCIVISNIPFKFVISPFVHLCLIILHIMCLYDHGNGIQSV